MAIYYLKLSAELDNVSGVEPVDTQAEPFEYIFKVTCTSCRTTNDKAISINRFETYELKKSTAQPNFVFRCKECNKEHAASIERTTDKYNIEDNGKWVPLLQIDSRGIEFSEFIAEGKFQAQGVESGTKFEEIDLVDNEWYDYDDKAGAEVSITEVKWDIQRS